MIYKYVRWLPYWLVMKILRNQYSSDGQGILKLSKDYPVTYYQVSGGEFVVYSQDIQDIFNKQQESKRIKKMNKKMNKINKTLRGDYYLKKELAQQFEDDKLYE